MEHLIVTARNFTHVVIDDELHSVIEAVLTVAGKSMEYIGGSLVNAERTKTIRFGLSPRGAREFAKKLGEWADEVESEAERITLSPTVPTE